MDSKNNESNNSLENNVAKCKASSSNVSEENSEYINKDLQKILEAINDKNNSNIEQITNAFLKAIESIKNGNLIEQINNGNNIRTDDNITNNVSIVPFHIKNFHLSSINFNQWYKPLIHHLISSDLISFIETKRDISSMNQLEIKLDNKTQSIIEASLDKEGNDVLKGCNTAFEMMSRLKERYYQTGQSFIDNIDKQIKSLKIVNNDFLSFIHKMDELYNLRESECENLKKESLDDNYKITHMFRELIKTEIHPLFIYLVDCNSYNEFKEKMYKLNSLIETIKNLTVNNEESFNLINRVQKGKLPYNFDKNKNKKENKVPVEDNYCYICEIHGHTTKNCFKIKDNKNELKNNKLNKGKKRKSKFKSKRSNKNFKSCNVINNKENQIKDNYDSDSDDIKSLNFNVCNIKCSLVKNSEIKNIINVCNNEKTKEEEYYNIEEVENGLTTWIVDSGTAINIIGNINKLVNVNPVGTRSVTYANGNSEPINQIGTYKGTYNHNEFSITDVYYAQNIQNNLISTNHFLDLGYGIYMKEINGVKKMFILENDKIIMTINANKENLFTIKSKDNLNDNDINFVNNYKYLINYIEHDLWHSRLGHFVNNELDNYVKERTKRIHNEDCKQCKISKMRRSKFQLSSNKTKSCLELIHTDVVGRLKTSHNGYKFYVTFLDDFSRKCWVYPIKLKSEVYTKFIEFYELMKNKYNLIVKTLKSDRGAEYINNDFNKFVKEHGIDYIHSEPGAHEQNGRAERLNQTLNNCAKTMLNWAKLPIQFWNEAIVVAAKLYNLNPHQGNCNLVPDEIFFNKISDISHLKVFGCKVAFFNNYKRDKFDNNAKQGIFMGYSSDSTGYRILDLETNYIITARDVYFFENLPGSINTPFFTNEMIITLLDSPSPIEGEKSININNYSNNNSQIDNIQLNEAEHYSNNNKKRKRNSNQEINDNKNIIVEKIRKVIVKDMFNKILNIKTNVPLTFKQAINSKDGENWSIAITKEFKNIYDNHVVTVVDGS
eukprot:jgi/Orpsp1_1/1174943/evm.model.c7180000052037.1